MLIPDRPGVLAQVTTIAGELGVNIEDFEIVHSQYRPRGVLILTVAADAAERVRHALAEHGFGLQPGRRTPTGHRHRRPGGRRQVDGGEGSGAAARPRTARHRAPCTVP